MMNKIKRGAPLLLLTLPAIVGCGEQKPNIIIIVADDAGYGDFGFMGSTNTETPNIDALAKRGTYFTDAHVAATVSSPSRAMLMTGRQGQRFGYECNTSNKGNGLPENEEILPQLLKNNGYRTACIGKWHLGALDFQHPNAKGFDEFYGLIGGSRSYFHKPEKDDNPSDKIRQYQHNGTQIKFDGYFTDELTQKAKHIIALNDDPFMMYLSYTAPHSPNEAKKEDFDRFKGNERQTYAAMLYGLDRGVGEVVAELERTGKLDNTIIFFISDNGGATTNGAANYPLKGFKGNKFEGGHRVPFIAAWGDRLRSDLAFEGLTSSLDIFATVVDVADVAVGGDGGSDGGDVVVERDGVSLIPYITGVKSGDPHNTLYWRKMDSRAIRDGNYKLILTQNVDTVLYNLSTDLVESNNLLYSECDKAAELIHKLAKWEEEEWIDPAWIEDGWAPITNGYHERLMNNDITYTKDLKSKKKKKK